VAPHRIFHIPNGVNEDDFRSSDVALFRKKIGIANVPYILFVGRLNPIKGPDLLLSAFSKLKNDLPHHLIFAGPDGGMSEPLKQQALELNLKELIQ
jgi:glycosyltransferase involved in cell wall biosynthesis